MPSPPRRDGVPPPQPHPQQRPGQQRSHPEAGGAGHRHDEDRQVAQGDHGEEEPHSHERQAAEVGAGPGQPEHQRGSEPMRHGRAADRARLQDRGDPGAECRTERGEEGKRHV